jgi:hypothetical protein
MQVTYYIEGFQFVDLTALIDVPDLTISNTRSIIVQTTDHETYYSVFSGH